MLFYFIKKYFAYCFGDHLFYFLFLRHLENDEVWPLSSPYQFSLLSKIFLLKFSFYLVFLIFDSNYLLLSNNYLFIYLFSLEKKSFYQNTLYLNALKKKTHLGSIGSKIFLLKACNQISFSFHLILIFHKTLILSES